MAPGLHRLADGVLLADMEILYRLHRLLLPTQGLPRAGPGLAVVRGGLARLDSLGGSQFRSATIFLFLISIIICPLLSD